jgi:sugar phosphate isomerase/epimerase
MKLGILSKVFARPTVEAVFGAVAAAGLECIQLNLESAGLAAVPEEIPAGLPERIRRAAAEGGIGIASVQATFNMSHPDEAFRRDGLRRLERIAGSVARHGCLRGRRCSCAGWRSRWCRAASRFCAGRWPARSPRRIRDRLSSNYLSIKQLAFRGDDVSRRV